MPLHQILTGESRLNDTNIMPINYSKQREHINVLIYSQMRQTKTFIILNFFTEKTFKMAMMSQKNNKR